MFSRGFLSAGTERVPHPKLNLVLRQIGSSSQVGENNISKFTPPHGLIADYCKYRVNLFFFRIPMAWILQNTGKRLDDDKKTHSVPWIWMFNAGKTYPNILSQILV